MTPPRTAARFAAKASRSVTAQGILEGVRLSREYWWGIVASLVITVAAAGSVPWWGKYVGWGTDSAAPKSAVTGMAGGCGPFEAIAQNELVRTSFPLVSGP
jgi:hypothetical protein